MVATLVLPYAERLIACLCDALQATVGGPVCRCSLAPGTAPPPADACCNCDSGAGQATVQITDTYATVAGKFPTRANGQMDNCGLFEFAAELTMVVYRCVSVADEKSFPSGEELAADARKTADDEQAMLQAMLCCDWRDRGDGELQPIIPGSWRPLSPLGGCAGGQMSVTVLVGGLCCSPQPPA